MLEQNNHWKIWKIWAVERFFRQLRSKSCFKKSYLKKPLKTVEILRGFWAVFIGKTVQKPLKPLILKQDFERNCLKKTAQTAQILLQIRWKISTRVPK